MKRTHYVRLGLLAGVFLAIAAIYFTGHKEAAPTGDPNEHAHASSGLGAEIRAPAQNVNPEAIAFDAANQIRASLDPLLPRYDDLVVRARSGDTKAALQLNADLRQCIEGQRLLKAAGRKSRPRLMDSRTSESMQVAPEEIERAAALLERAEALLALCDGISPEDLRNAGDWLLMAAELGDTEAILTYAVHGGPDSYTDEPPITYAEELVRFKQRAGELLHAAARRCEPYAINMLQGAYWHGSFFPRDPVRSLAYHYVVRWAEGSPQGVGEDRMGDVYSAQLQEDDVNAAREMAQRFMESNCR